MEFELKYTRRVIELAHDSIIYHFEAASDNASKYRQMPTCNHLRYMHEEIGKLAKFIQKSKFKSSIHVKALLVPIFELVLALDDIIKTGTWSDVCNRLLNKKRNRLDNDETDINSLKSHKKIFLGLL